MELDQDSIKAARKYAAVSTGEAPDQVVAAMLALMSPSDIKAWLALKKNSGAETAWEIVWVGASCIVYGIGSAPGNDWDAGTYPSQAWRGTVLATLRGVTEIRSLTVADVEHGEGQSVDVGCVITFRDGGTITLPTQTRSRLVGGEVDAVLDALRSAIVTSH